MTSCDLSGFPNSTDWTAIAPILRSTAKLRNIGEAAKAAHESVAHLLLRAALKEADEILGREVDVTRMPASEYEALPAALDSPAEAIPELARIAARPSRHVRR